MILSASALDLKDRLSLSSAQKKIRAIVEAVQKERITRAEAILLTDEACINGIDYTSIGVVDQSLMLVNHCPGAPGASTGLIATSLRTSPLKHSV
jgi:hypothetical protein